jgi:hypothetical protein
MHKKMRYTQILPLLLLSTAPVMAQSTATVAFESFDYATGGLGGLGGGAGWFNTWWSGNNSDDALVSSGSLDSIGNKTTTNWEHAGSYRVPESGPHTDIAPDGRFGSGDGVMWISFQTQRAGSDDYGGFSLNEQFVGEKLFIGSPWQTYEWGMEDPATGTRVLVGGSNIDTVTRVVVRLTFTSTGETADMWLNPASTHPSGTPDASLALGDFAWNEIRLQSGGNNGGTTAYDFDEILIEKEVPGIGTNYCTSNLNSTGVAATMSASGSSVVVDNNLTLEASNLPLNQFGYFIGSRTQGFVANPGGSQGNICLGAPIARFNSIGGYSIGNSGSSGTINLLIDMNNIPLTPVTSVLAGETWNFQAWYRDMNPGTVNNFTDGLSITFQ